MTKLLLIGVGGFLGAIARHGAGTWVSEHFGRERLPAGTLAVNLLGCFLIGLLFRLAEHLPVLDRDLRPLVFVGFLGGFTTFSTFGLEMLGLWRDHGPLPTIGYAAASVVGGLLLTWGGYALAGAFLPHPPP